MKAATPASIDVLGDAKECAARAAAGGGTGLPTRIVTHADLVAVARALPLPVTLPCFLVALPRPLAIVGTLGVTSLQPADGPTKPRIFFRSGKGGSLVLSIGFMGDGAEHIETGEHVGSGRSVKGDLGFPLNASLSETAFFSGIAHGANSDCAFCHGGERAERIVEGVPAFSSGALRPASYEAVSVDTIKALADACAERTPRCMKLRALFTAPKDTVPLVFPSDYSSF